MEEETKEETTENNVKKPEFEKPLSKMTAPELKEVAMEIPGLTGVHAMQKPDLIAVIREYYGIEEEEPGKGKKKKVKLQVDVKEVKKKIVQLRERREQARAAKDKKGVEILRRRINRLKKQTRKVAQG
ncbi:MAG: transcription termination factor Rho [Deltaproteobacteria bacterium]|nr:transcription termination factor Rho [Deltaproteobacteria bacterium]MBW2048274.1 transcription termination factor Rho [Deltaproteobacteria bacterium]MBW2109996.1 transcription termination factor Rho [Deltaproteobacteria bacterium]MBW2351803.1 transcription termination factor Rho [Deltaproteobacteria bacterium]HDZ89072.1 transcription termination factor Rho [Deltaproteobacteria bacterium]